VLNGVTVVVLALATCNIRTTEARIDRNGTAIRAVEVIANKNTVSNAVQNTRFEYIKRELSDIKTLIREIR